MNKYPKFNVIIPTRERADTLYHSLRTVVEQDYDNLNIIVSDNFSRDNTREVVASFADRRVKYINTGKRISMSHNYEFALSHVTDGWVSFLGDDDGMLPGGLSRVEQVIAETTARAIVSKWRFYFWPKSTGPENQLTIPLSTGYEERDCKTWLSRLMKGTADYFELPYIYTGGFVDIELINAARDKNGAFFCSMIPDVYSAIALSSTTERYVMLHEPICVMGVSSHSNGASQFSATNRQGPSEQFFSEKNIPFHPRLGSERIKSITIIIYECYLQSAHLHNDALKLDMSDQLALALQKSSPEYYGELRKYCDEVIAKNGIAVKQLEKAIHRAVTNPRMWTQRIKAVISAFNNLTLDASRYYVSNVYGAALLTRAIHQFNSSNKYWRLTKLIRLLTFVIAKLFRMKRNM